jgi:hypothetical protein
VALLLSTTQDSGSSLEQYVYIPCTLHSQMAKRLTFSKDFAHDQAIATAKILALTGLEVLRNETYAKAMWAEWRDMIDEASEGL